LLRTGDDTLEKVGDTWRLQVRNSLVANITDGNVDNKVNSSDNHNPPQSEDSKPVRELGEAAYLFKNANEENDYKI
jgi:hypothetical protein